MFAFYILNSLDSKATLMYCPVNLTVKWFGQSLQYGTGLFKCWLFFGGEGTNKLFFRHFGKLNITYYGKLQQPEFLNSGSLYSGYSYSCRVRKHKCRSINCLKCGGLKRGTAALECKHRKCTLPFFCYFLVEDLTFEMTSQ